MADTMSNEEIQATWGAMVQDIRTGVLLTLRNGQPFGPHVPFIFGRDWTRAYLHLSRLARHTNHVLVDPRLSLFLSEADDPKKNPLAFKRMNLQGVGAMLMPESPHYEEVKNQYVARFPQSKMLFGLGGFQSMGIAVD